MRIERGAVVFTVLIVCPVVVLAQPPGAPMLDGSAVSVKLGHREC